MRPVDHREPGPAIALLEDARVTVEMITDGVHLHPALYREVTAGVGPDRVALMTDAMAASGMADGAYRLGSLPVDVRDGIARVAGTDTIAGSTATMNQVFRFAVLNIGLPREEALPVAVRQTSINPSRTLGRPDPTLAPGAAADLVIPDDELAVAGVLHRAPGWCRRSRCARERCPGCPDHPVLVLGAAHRAGQRHRLSRHPSRSTSQARSYRGMSALC